MPLLSTLKLAGNQLQGELTTPPFLCDRDGLQYTIVDLSFNQLSGTMQFFKYYSRLTSLNIRNNLFHGPIDLVLRKVSAEEDCAVSDVVVSSLIQLDVSSNTFSEVLNIPGSITSFSAARCALGGSVAPLRVLVSAVFIDVQDNPNLSGDIPLEIVTSRFLLYLFTNNTNMRSSNVGFFPGLSLDSSVRQIFVVGENFYQCPVVHSEASHNAFLSISPAYFSYSGCSCGVGYSGPHVENDVAVCKLCPPGTYNDQDDVTVCSHCPTDTYSSVKGSFQCLPCALPLRYVLKEGRSCIDLTLIYILSFLFILLSITALIIMTVVVLTSVGAGYRLLKWWRSRELHRVTLLIQKRARDEIPADLLIRYRDLKLDVIIGTGSFARVYRGSWNHTLVAIKELTGVLGLMATLQVEKNGTLKNEDYHNDAGIQRLVNEFKSEVLVMSRLHHPNVLLLVGACSDFPHLCIVTEYLSNGSLYDALHRKHAALQISSARQLQWLGETASGMAYLHDQGLMHRDLKSLNVLLDDANRAKLCDFGLARVVSDAQCTMTGGVGSMLWMAPEVMTDATYDYSADVYAWGILAWEIMSPEADLFPGKSVMEVSRAVLQGKRPPLHPSWPVGVCEVMVMSWSGLAEERLTFKEVVERLGPLIGVTRDGTTEEMTEEVDDLSKPLLQV